MKLSLVGAGYRYGDQWALSGITHAFGEGLVTGLIGPNGSGKTTMMRLLWGELSPTEGSALLDGQEVGKVAERRRARMVSVVPQRSHLEFDFTVLDMVLMGRQPFLGRFEREGERDLSMARGAIDRMGIAHLSTRNARTLSGGEWQRVLIARALCQHTPVLLMDEPVSSLDIRHQMEVLREIRALSLGEGVTVAVVLHDLNLAAHYCDRLLLLSEGRLLAQGVPEQVLTAQWLRQAYGIEARIEHDEGGVSVRPNYLLT